MSASSWPGRRAAVRQRSGARSLASAQNGWVRLIGYVPDAALVALVGSADAVAYPSRYEGFGLPVLEALACGAVVVAADRTSIPEVAGDAAILVDPDSDDALAAGLLRALTDEPLRAASRRGRTTAGHEVRLGSLRGGDGRRLPARPGVLTAARRPGPVADGCVTIGAMPRLTPSRRSPDADRPPHLLDHRQHHPGLAGDPTVRSPRSRRPRLGSVAS